MIRWRVPYLAFCFLLPIHFLLLRRWQIEELRWLRVEDVGGSVLAVLANPQSHHLMATTNESVPWLAGYPVSIFTPHVLEVISNMAHDSAAKKCYTYFEIEAAGSDSPPKVHYVPHPKQSSQGDTLYQMLIQRIFSSAQPKRAIPYNISFGSSASDVEKKTNGCIGSSSKGGLGVMMNFHYINQWLYGAKSTYEGKLLDAPRMIPWHRRETLPVWRGTLWILPLYLCVRKDFNATYEDILRSQPGRAMLMDYAVDNPTKLDASFSGVKRVAECFAKNATNGLSKLLPKSTKEKLDPMDYYRKYQAAVVVGGIGAAFRTTMHLRMGQAVILADFEYEEWFTKLMEPWVHFIPLDLRENNTDLDSKMQWVEDHPSEVKAIADRGHQFYQQYLTFEASKEHFYEFLYRLSLYRRHFNISADSLSSASAVELRSDTEMTKKTAPHVVVAPKKNGFIDDVQLFCEELLHRANGTQEGEEPWRLPGGGIVYEANDCRHQGKSVLGNHLSRWYYMRAIAAGAGVTIRASCTSPITDWLGTIIKPSDTILDHAFSWRDVCTTCEGCKWGPHGKKKDGLDLVAKTIQKDLQQLAKETILFSEPVDFDEVSIHLRTGDIIRQKNRMYGVVPFRVYAKYIPPNARTIGIVTAPFRQKRQGWGHGEGDINEAIVQAAQKYIQTAFPQATVSIRNNEEEPMDVAYSRMIVANTTICGPSTFCLFPAVASMGESFIVQSPLFGDSPNWIDETANNALPNIHHINENYFKSFEIYNLSASTIVEMLQQ